MFCIKCDKSVVYWFPTEEKRVVFTCKDCFNSVKEEYTKRNAHIGDKGNDPKPRIPIRRRSPEK